jgi:hypothetical protein
MTDCHPNDEIHKLVIGTYNKLAESKSKKVLVDQLLQRDSLARGSLVWRACLFVA